MRGGEVVGAATNFRFNDSPVGVLTRVADAGSAVPTLAREMGDYFNRAAMPPLARARLQLLDGVAGELTVNGCRATGRVRVR